MLLWPSFIGTAPAFALERLCKTQKTIFKAVEPRDENLCLKERGKTLLETLGGGVQKLIQIGDFTVCYVN